MLIAAIILVFVGTVAIAGWGYLTAARLRETEGRGVAIQRQIAWANSHAIDQQYNYTLGYQDGVTLTPSTTLVNTGAGGIVATGFNNLSAAYTPQPVQIQQTPLANLNLANVVGTTLNSALPVFNGFSGALNIGIVMVNSANLPNVELTGNLDMVILLGDLVTTNASFDASLAPVIIWVDQSTHPRHIIFLGQSTRQVILVTGAGTGAATYCAFVGVSDLLGAPLPWRLQWINQDCDLEIIPPTQFGYANITGSVRTNWTFNVIDTLTTNTRMVIQRDTSPGSLNTLMPRDAWFSSCYRPQ